uniref:Uncharacterized protein n=1 Tax=Callorhinchus milii TaxID=7868 RepID=A0A4W3J5U8_CALMI
MHDFRRTVKEVIRVVKVCESTLRKSPGQTAPAACPREDPLQDPHPCLQIPPLF